MIFAIFKSRWVSMLECDVKQYKWLVLFILKHQVEELGALR
jgi:hypothetical protein